MSPIIQMKHIRKQFLGVLALNDVSFDLYPGEVHVLIGENGAGKSTLIKILGGVYTPTKGTIVVDGKEYSKLTTKLAKELGISVIFQELSVINTLSIEENLFVGKLPTKKTKLFLPIIDKKLMTQKAKNVMEKVGLDIDPKTMVSELSISQKQLVEIAKSLVSKAKILVMDEPTSSLNENEVENLFQVIKGLQKDGVAVIYISHKLRELKKIGDRITILKDGESVLTTDGQSISDDDIVSHMVGRELKGLYYNKEVSHISDECIFEAKHIQRSDNKVKDISFKLFRGEILGFSGLVGSGRTELMEAIFGAIKNCKGQIYLKRKKVKIATPYHSIKNGIGMITENRRETGFIPNFEIKDNLVIAKSSKVSRANGLIGMIHKKQESEDAENAKDELGIKCSSVNQLITDLSGGNQQKVIIGKWLNADSQILIFDEPTRGIDVGAKNEIYKIMRNLANQGKGVLMISSELPELLSICDRIIVVAEGEIQGELNAYEATEEKIMKLATK